MCSIIALLLEILRNIVLRYERANPIFCSDAQKCVSLKKTNVAQIIIGRIEKVQNGAPKEIQEWYKNKCKTHNTDITRDENK